MSHQEIHKLLDDLKWEDVKRLASEDPSIRKHLNKCQDCQDRENKIVEGELASMGAAKRNRQLEVARQLADYFLNKSRPS